MKPRKFAARLLVAVLFMTGVGAWHWGYLPSVVPPANNAYVGLTRQQIIDRLGKPDGQWPGHYGNPPIDWASQYEPCETLTYLKWSGTLYISVYQKNGQWVCFCSNWPPKGAAF